MQHVMGSTEPNAVDVFLDLGGTRWARLRKNIHDDWADVPQDSEKEPVHFWEWDEVIIQSDLEIEELEEQLDALWYDQERIDMADATWRKDVDAQLLDIMEELVG